MQIRRIYNPLQWQMREQIFTFDRMSERGYKVDDQEAVHLNPVRAELVEKEEEYLRSSSGDFYGTRKGSLELAIW